MNVRADCAALSHQGLVRANNEDSFLVARFGRYFMPLAWAPSFMMPTQLPPGVDTGAPNADALPGIFEEAGYGLVVADGMGGAAAGEVASRLAIQTLLALTFDAPDWVFGKKDREAERRMERLGQRFRAIDAHLRETGRRDPNLKGMGTTMTLACSVGLSLVLVHVGDSRAYLLRGGAMHQLTRDHTLAQALVDQGFLDQEDLAFAPVRHMLTRVLGGFEEGCEPDVHRLGLADGDRLLLCSDGLTGMVDDPAIAAILLSAATPGDACQALVEAALDNGGRDNVTVAIAHFRAEP